MDGSNREAYQVCRDIAELRPVTPQPVVLFGESGSGKTHLLYAIVNEVQKASPENEVKFAVLNPRRLPAEIRGRLKAIYVEGFGREPTEEDLRAVLAFCL